MKPIDIIGDKGGLASHVYRCLINNNLLSILMFIAEKSKLNFPDVQWFLNCTESINVKLKGSVVCSRYGQGLLCH